MTVALLATAVVVLTVALVVLLVVLERAAVERAALVRAVIAKHAGEAVGLERAVAPRPAAAPRKRDEGEPPPGTQPVGLSGGSW